MRCQVGCRLGAGEGATGAGEVDGCGGGGAAADCSVMSVEFMGVSLLAPAAMGLADPERLPGVPQTVPRAGPQARNQIQPRRVKSAVHSESHPTARNSAMRTSVPWRAIHNPSNTAQIGVSYRVASDSSNSPMLGDSRMAASTLQGRPCRDRSISVPGACRDRAQCVPATTGRAAGRLNRGNR